MGDLFVLLEGGGPDDIVNIGEKHHLNKRGSAIPIRMAYQIEQKACPAGMSTLNLM